MTSCNLRFLISSGTSSLHCVRPRQRYTFRLLKLAVGRSLLSHRVREHESRVVLNLLHQSNGVSVLLLSFAAESANEVAAQAHVGKNVADMFNQGQIRFSKVED
jgi:hypothetical protein